MNEKLYFAKQTIEAIFISDESNVLPNASFFLKEEFLNNSEALKTYPITWFEIKTKEEIPELWKDNSIIYNTAEHITASKYFDLIEEETKQEIKNHQDEYNKYLELKAKFEHHKCEICKL